MSEDKKKDGDAKAEAGKKKKGLPPIVLIVVGAIVGGAGAVFAIPPKTVQVEVKPVQHQMLDLLHPDAIQHEFNPRTKAGKGMVRVSFKFRYTVRDDNEAAAFETLKKRWEEAKHSSLLLLKQRSMEELQTDAGIQVLQRDLIENLDQMLFPAGKDKVAKVTMVLFDKWLMQ